LEVDVDKKKRNKLRNLRQKVAKLKLEPGKYGRHRQRGFNPFAARAKEAMRRLV